MRVTPIPKTPRIFDRKTFDQCKTENCEVCGAPAHGIGPHHIITRGAGGADIPENLIQLCWTCHYVKIPAGKYSQDFLFAKVGKRLRKSGEECRKAVRRAMGYYV
ncbi:HNH endonuclease signature motif containing protein [Sporomusa sphaeroides]|uniref:HNH endonuclease signature motif containing protein n=1 Tax=Sporomusa sphaeroides TaxID=47679 RepID=UPI003A520D94